MSDEAALGMIGAGLLDLAHRQARRARGDQGRGREQLVQLGVEFALEVDPFRSVLLHQVRALHRVLELWLEPQTLPGGARRQSQLLQRRPALIDEGAQTVLGARRDIGGDHVQALGQEERRPAGADHARSNDGDAADGRMVHGVAPQRDLNWA